MLSRNIVYKSKQILEFYSSHRQRWKDFYPSEQWVFKKVAAKKKIIGDVLDVGCSCGGLAAALSQKFKINSYTGVDINEETIKWARNNQKLPIAKKFISGDILKQKLNRQYDWVVSLSCADWNIETNKIIEYCWNKVKPGGYFIISLRITKAAGINDMDRSYQCIDFSGKEDNPEVVNYVVFNFLDTLAMFGGLWPRPKIIGAYGYWGKPSPTARTPFKKLVFAVYYIKKDTEDLNSNTPTLEIELNLPFDFLSAAILRKSRVGCPTN
ncbi:MAG: class I SAM-dependent methyltransferase [Candidatus Omnitrophota bacterium]|nr:class I SAM-dependent methyltransferase [Candidatus Omnitrophota bacterium]